MIQGRHFIIWIYYVLFRFCHGCKSISQWRRSGGKTGIKPLYIYSLAAISSISSASLSLKEIFRIYF